MVAHKLREVLLIIGTIKPIPVRRNVLLHVVRYREVTEQKERYRTEVRLREVTIEVYNQNARLPQERATVP